MQTMSDMKDATLAYYPLKGDTNDYTSNNRNGVATNDVSYVPGVYGSAANFQTSGASVQLPIDKFSRYADQYVLSAWVNMVSCSPVPGEHSASGNIAGRLAVSYQTGKLQFFFYYDSPTAPDNQLIVLESKSVLPTETWINVLVMYDQTTRTFSFFLNGILDSVVSLSQKVASNDRPHLPVPFAIGGNYSGFTEHNTFNGSISDVIIMNTVLDTCCINCVSGVMNFTGIRGAKDKEVTRTLTGIHPEGEVVAIALFAFVAVMVVVAIAAIVVEQILVNKIEDQPIAPPSPKQPTLSQMAVKIAELVGSPAQPGKRATREAVGIPWYQRVHVDIGGLGPYVHRLSNETSGFVDSLNINDVTTNPDSTPPDQPVPYLILVDKWGTNPMYPLGDGFADYVTMQSAPLFSNYVSEIARIVRPGGEVGLWIDQQAFHEQIDQLARIFNCTPLPCTGKNLGMDEFGGKYVFPKLLLTKKDPGEL